MKPIAYSILFHKDFDQFIALMRNIYDLRHVYAVHLDADAPEGLHKRLATFAKYLDNVHVVQPISCIWAGWSLVESELRCIRLLTGLRHDWEYHINLSGQDMPLRSQAEITNFLSRHPGCNFMVVLDPISDWWAPHRFQRLNFEQRVVGKSLVRVPRYNRPFMRNKSWHGGSQWKILSREFCNFLSDQRNTAEYERFFRYAYMPDEQFFQTLAMNTSFRQTIVPDHQRYIVFPDHTAHPQEFDSANFDELANCGKLFARKFSSTNDAAIIRRIENELIGHSLASSRAGRVPT